MVHVMKLKRESFEKMKLGKKTVELRLYDYKRRRLNVGDSIVFRDYDDNTREIAVTIKSLHRYQTFEDLFNEIPVERCGNDKTEPPENAAARMNSYYTDDQIRIFGVVGIGIQLTDLETVKKQMEDEEEARFNHYFPDGMK